MDEVGDLSDGFVTERQCSDVRGDRDTGVIPERMVWREWLLSCNVQRRSADQTGSHRFQQIVLDKMLASSCIDQISAMPKVAEVVQTEYAFRFGGQWQNADQNADIIQERCV